MTDEGSAGLLWRTPPWAARVASGKYSQAPTSDRFGAFRPAALRAWSAGDAPYETLPVGYGESAQLVCERSFAIILGAFVVLP
jgi:hypothetical protein